MQCTACENDAKSKGFCNKHYQQMRKYGKVIARTVRDFNETVDKGSYIELILTDKDMNERGRAKIDKEDLEKVKKFGRWHLTIDGYVGCVSRKSGKQKTVLMHRIIVDLKTGEWVDHKKVGVEHRSDNRKNNLRRCSIQQNNCNTVMRKDNTSGYKGVFWNEKNSNWRAIISVNSKSIRLGSFKTAKSASIAYNKAAKEYHGDFANV